MTATPDDIQRGVKAIEGAYSQAGAWLYPDLIGHILAAVLPAHDARIRADDAEWLREWFASGPDPAQGDRLLRAFVARADGVSGQEDLLRVIAALVSKADGGRVELSERELEAADARLYVKTWRDVGTRNMIITVAAAEPTETPCA